MTGLLVGMIWKTQGWLVFWFPTWVEVEKLTTDLGGFLYDQILWSIF